MTGHTVYWVRPAEQRQMMRIILFDVVFSIASFFSIYFYGSAVYNTAWATFYEGLAMTALFLLYVQLICPNPNHRAQYFHDLQLKSKSSKPPKGSGGSLKWYRVSSPTTVEVTMSDNDIVYLDQGFPGRPYAFRDSHRSNRRRSRILSVI